MKIRENKKSLSMKKGKRSEKNLDNTENFFFKKNLGLSLYPLKF
jgi:hypothetical protein